MADSAYEKESQKILTGHNPFISSYPTYTKVVQNINELQPGNRFVRARYGNDNTPPDCICQTAYTFDNKIYYYKISNDDTISLFELNTNNNTVLHGYTQNNFQEPFDIQKSFVFIIDPNEVLNYGWRQLVQFINPLNDPSADRQHIYNTLNTFKGEINRNTNKNKIDDNVKKTIDILLKKYAELINNPSSTDPSILPATSSSKLSLIDPASLPATSSSNLPANPGTPSKPVTPYVPSPIPPSVPVPEEESVALFNLLQRSDPLLLDGIEMDFMPHPIEEYEYNLIPDLLLHCDTLFDELRIRSIIKIRDQQLQVTQIEVAALNDEQVLEKNKEVTALNAMDTYQQDAVKRDALVKSFIGTTPVDNTKPMLKTFKIGLLYLYDLGRLIQESKSDLVKNTAIVTGPIVAIVELILGIISILLVMVEAFLTNRHNENVSMHRQLYAKAQLLVEKLPDVYPIDSLETGNTEDAMKQRLRYLFSFTSKKTTFQEVEETFSKFKISKGEGMDGNNIDDAPIPAFTETVELGLDDPNAVKKVGDNTPDKVGMLIDFIVYPIRVKEFMKGEGVPFQADMVVRKKKDSAHSFIYQVEHLLNETTAILKRMTPLDNNVTGTVEQQQKNAANANAANANANANATNPVISATNTNAAIATNKSPTFSEYIKEMQKAATDVKDARRVFVENMLLTDKGSNNEDNMHFENLLDLFQEDTEQNFLSRHFIQLSKYILKTYLALLK